MITVEEALSRLEKVALPPVTVIDLPLQEALNHTLAATVTAPVDLPPFRQSAMDGYALNINGATRYKITGEVKAGDSAQPVLQPGEAIRIFTGAPVPDTANAVVMQEKTRVNLDELLLETAAEPEMNIRPVGEQVKKGQATLAAGSRLNAATIGFLAGMGIEKVKVHQKLSVAVVVTGNELVPPGQTLEHGQIYESNGAMLMAALKSLGYTEVSLYNLKDEFESTRDHLKNILHSHNLVLVSGGISVGDYDFVGKALNALGVQEVFYKIAQKPGKPLYFGKTDKTAVFALPGNPAAALTCFMVYVLRYLQRMEGRKPEGLPQVKVPLQHSYSRKGNRAEFLKARVTPEGVEILGRQASSMLGGFYGANALACIASDTPVLEKGDRIPVIVLPDF